MRSYPLAALATLLVLAVPGVLRADELLKPLKAHKAMSAALKKIPKSKRDDEARRRSIEYLEKWNASGRKPTSADSYALAQFLESAGRLKESAKGFAGVQADPGASEKAKDNAAEAEARLMRKPELREQLSTAERMAALKRLSAYAATMAGQPSRSKYYLKLLDYLAELHEIDGNPEAAFDARMRIVKDNAKKISTHLKPIVQDLLSMATSLDAYDGLRAKAKTALDTLATLQQGQVDAAKAKLDAGLAKLKAADPGAVGPDGRLVKTDPHEMSKAERVINSSWRSYDTATALLASIKAKSRPFTLLGKPAPAWTLVHAYGDASSLKDLAGKVVVLDFWATWTGVCNFPVMRDLMRDFADKGFTVVGVTTTSNVVYASRYDVDADMKSRDNGHLFYAARLASEDTPADASKAIFDEAKYREKEQEAIERFIKNHELNWPNVMIAKDDPREKYCMEGWPHMVVLDKQGRIRLIRGGLLQRDDTKEVGALRATIQSLLNE